MPQIARMKEISHELARINTKKKKATNSTN